MTQQHGSLQNLLAGSSASSPEIGMGATFVMWTDREPGTITLVSMDKTKIWVSRDKATRIDNNGMSEMQEYTFERGEDPLGERYTLRKNGHWIAYREPMKDGRRVVIGYRSKYHDYSF
jgi:hypothetical protein